ncbi:MAG: hypothetical protein FJ253_12030, partial [Phycisphaerae bacterium]|nr:hypothetical protein [Phycisphaerae bacterium]
MPSKNRTVVVATALALASIGAISTARAEGESYRFDPLPVALRDVLSLLPGNAGGGEGGLAECAQVVRTHSGANFSGGSFTIQAG